MPKRLFSLLTVLVTCGLVLSATAAAQTMSLTSVRGAGLRFDAQGVSLKHVTAAHLSAGSEKIALRTATLRKVATAQRVIVSGVKLTHSQRDHAKLTLTLKHPFRRAAGDPLAVAARSDNHGTRSVKISPLPDQTPTDFSSTGLRVGINVGSAIDWELQFASALGAKNVRMSFAIDTPTSQMDSIIEDYAKQGIRAELLATFDGTIPTAADIANLAAWAKRYGPGGTFWAQTGLPASLAVTRIEFGNESSANYQYASLADNSDWYATPTYNQIAEGYGAAYVSAVKAVNAANDGVRVLAVADSSGNVPQWLEGMFASTPDFGSYVEGWVLHPYGSEWKTDIDKTLAQAQSLGASSSIPVYITEVGLATDNGNCLSDNYGYNPCMTYADAANTLTSQVAGIKADLGNRLQELDLYSARDIDATGTSTDMEGYFGALQSNGDSKGAFTAAVENILATTTS